MKCSNCDSDAFYVYQVTMDKVFPYCGNHLPGFLEARRQAGNLLTTDAWERERASALDALKVTPAPVIETKEEPVEVVATKKKAAPKKKAK